MNSIFQTSYRRDIRLSPGLLRVFMACSTLLTATSASAAFTWNETGAMTYDGTVDGDPYTLSSDPGNDVSISNGGSLTVQNGTLNIQPNTPWGDKIAQAGTGTVIVSAGGILSWTVDNDNEDRLMIGNGSGSATVNLNGGDFIVTGPGGYDHGERNLRFGSDGGRATVNLSAGTFGVSVDIPVAFGGKWTVGGTTFVQGAMASTMTIGNGWFKISAAGPFRVGDNSSINFISGGSGGLSIKDWTQAQFETLVTAGRIRKDGAAATLADFTYALNGAQGEYKLNNTVSLPPAIATEPENREGLVGQTVTFTALASGNPTPTLQWESSPDNGATWIPIAGATFSSYTTPALTAQMEGDLFRMIATNSQGSATTLEAVLTVSFPVPAITSQPVSISADRGTNPEFFVEGTGMDPVNFPLQYQWQSSADLGATWTDLPGATADTLPIANVQPADAALFRVIVRDPAASQASQPPTETISAAVYLEITDPSAAFFYAENSAMVYDGSPGGADALINPKTIFDNDIAIGDSATGSLVVEGGSLTLNSVFQWSAKIGKAAAGNGTVTVNAGTLTINDAGNDEEARFMIGATAIGLVNINGGSMIVSIGADNDPERGFYLGRGDVGTLGGTVNLMGGSLLYTSNAPVFFGRDPSGARACYGVMNIDDGTFSVTGSDQVSFGGVDDYLNFIPGGTGSISILGWDSATDPGYSRFKALIDAGNIRIGGTAASAGSYGNFIFSDSNGLGVMKVDPTYVAAYAGWAAANAGSQGPDLDFDHDGVDNGVEFFMNSAPGLTANPPLSAGKVTWVNGGNIPHTAYGTQFVVETSGDLLSWSEVAASDPALSNTAGAVSYTLPAGAAKIFVRLVVSPE